MSTIRLPNRTWVLVMKKRLRSCLNWILRSGRYFLTLHAHLALSLIRQFSETRSIRCPWSLSSSLQSHSRANKNSSCVSSSTLAEFSSYFHCADRKKVLKHHPDKKASSTVSETSNSLYLTGVNQNTNDDAFFKCIQKAHEVLTNPEKRRQFDSVDPVFLEFEEDMPTASEIKVSQSTLDYSWKVFHSFLSYFFFVEQEFRLFHYPCPRLRSLLPLFQERTRPWPWSYRLYQGRG